jgi:hypothetical protein
LILSVNFFLILNKDPHIFSNLFKWSTTTFSQSISYTKNFTSIKIQPPLVKHFDQNLLLIRHQNLSPTVNKHFNFVYFPSQFQWRLLFWTPLLIRAWQHLMERLVC